VLQPQEVNFLVWARFQFARRYFGNRFCFLFLQVLRCFSSLGLSHLLYVFKQMYYSFKNSGFPHSEILGYHVYLQLPEAYRCYSRPSSTSRVKEFIVLSCSVKDRKSTSLI